VKRVVLFDVDGTLVLTGGAGVRAMSRAFEEVFGIARGFDGIPMAGRTDPLILAAAMTRSGIVSDESVLTSFREVYLRRLAEELHQPALRKGVLPGVSELLTALADRQDVVLGLLTGNVSGGARLKLEHFNLWHFFACGAFGEEGADRNALVPVALERVEARGVRVASPRHVLVVGDTPLDVECALSAGARAIAVATGGTPASILREAGAEVVFPDLSDTQTFLRLLAGDGNEASDSSGK
jgi:phosphoglycolate phosphatase